jgi:hypothetical protein
MSITKVKNWWLIRTAVLVKESFEKFKATSIDKGYRDSQFKVNLLMQDEKRHAMFKELVK